jgi:tRNA pseudouridine38-40 synthase
MRFFLTLSYKGTAYHGWQVQQNAPSVQGVLQQALSTLTGEAVEVVGAGRTDTGVHAAHYVAHFDTASERPMNQDFIYHLNAILPKDIAAHAINRVPDEAHARFSALWREYKYFIISEKDPFRIDTAWRYPLPLDLERMNEAAAVLMQYSDFGSFCKLHGGNKTTICQVKSSLWVRDGNTLIYTVSADRFLRNMVRAVVGTLVDVGRGRIDLDGFRRIVEAGDRCAAGSSAPAHGLFLTDIGYPERDRLADEVGEMGSG